MVTKLQQRRSDQADDAIDAIAENYRYIMDPEEAAEYLTSLGDKHVALDFETTGLDPNYSHVRLSCIYHPDHGAALIDHHYAGAFNDLANEYYRDPFWIVYNAKFEANWFLHAMGDTDWDMMDVDFLAKVKIGGSHSSLAVMARRDLGIIMDKQEQLSDWSQSKLTGSQLLYAARDAVITWELFSKWLKETTQKQRDAASIFQDAVLPTVECEQTGMILDVPLHEKNIQTWKMKQEIALRRIRRWTPADVLPNPKSNKQVSDLIKKQLTPEALNAWPKTDKTEQLGLDRKTVQPIAAKAGYPFSRWLNALLRYRYYAKYLSTYGDTLVAKQHLEDRITYRLNIAQAATGRYSSSSINIQNIPRAPWVRRVFLPPAGFDHMVVADYSGIEVRVLAELSGDALLLQDAIYGDVHAGSASAIYGIPLDDILEGLQQEDARTKELRSRAKGFTFQNVYGAGAGALSVVLKSTVKEAQDALNGWADRYKNAYDYRYSIFDRMAVSGFLPVCDGRTVYVRKQDRSLPIASNYGVQGAAASVMYRAMYHVHRLRNERSNPELIRLTATVHDELLLAAVDGHEDTASQLLQEGMVQGWLDIFPGSDTNNLVEAKVGPTWGDAK